MKKKLFISHSGNSSPFASYLHQNFELLHPNISTWFSGDPKCLPDGQHLSSNIIEASQDCFGCIAVLTKQNMNRWWMTFEAGLFIGMGKPVFAVLCGESLPYNSQSLTDYPITTLGTKFSTMTDKERLFSLLVSINNFVQADWQCSDKVLKANIDNNFDTVRAQYNDCFGNDQNDIDDILSNL